jgi:dephospho-CoA kinase
MATAPAPARDWTVYRVGLTGGIASGKSFVATCFADLGVPVIDTDVLARDVVVPGSPGLQAVVQRFGTGVLKPDGSLDRPQLRHRVFADPAARARLDALLHPLILAAAEEQSRRLPGPYQIIVVPLLYESGFDARVDRVLAVDCPEALQRQRLGQRDGDDVAQIERILAAQRPGAALRARAHDHVDNSGTLAATRQRVGKLHRTYLERALESAG